MATRLSAQLDALAQALARSILETVRAASLDELMTMTSGDVESPSPVKRGPGRPPGVKNGQGKRRRGRTLLEAIGVIQKEFIEGSYRYGKKVYKDAKLGKWVVRLTENGEEVGDFKAMSYEKPADAYAKYRELTKAKIRPLIRVWK